MKSPLHTSLLLILASSLRPATCRDYTRRHLGHNLHETSTNHNSDDTDSNTNSKSSFYDLSSLTKREKLQMIQAAIKVNKLQDSIDWDERKDRFRDAVWRDLGGGSSGDSGDSGASSKENDNVVVEDESTDEEY